MRAHADCELQVLRSPGRRWHRQRPALRPLGGTSWQASSADVNAGELGLRLLCEMLTCIWTATGAEWGSPGEPAPADRPHRPHQKRREPGSAPVGCYSDRSPISGVSMRADRGIAALIVLGQRPGGDASARYQRSSAVCNVPSRSLPQFGRFLDIGTTIARPCAPTPDRQRLDTGLLQPCRGRRRAARAARGGFAAAGGRRSARCRSRCRSQIDDGMPLREPP